MHPLDSVRDAIQDVLFFAGETPREARTAKETLLKSIHQAGAERSDIFTVERVQQILESVRLLESSSRLTDTEGEERFYEARRQLVGHQEWLRSVGLLTPDAKHPHTAKATAKRHSKTQQTIERVVKLKAEGKTLPQIRGIMAREGDKRSVEAWQQFCYRHGLTKPNET